MSQVTDPIILNSTGQLIVTKLQGIIDTLKTPTVKVSPGDNRNLVLDVAGEWGPMSSATSYFVPLKQDGTEAKLNLSLPFEICCKFKLMGQMDSYPRLIWGGENTGKQCPTIAVYNNSIVYYISTDGNYSTWSYGPVSITPNGYSIPLNTWIVVKLTWDGTDFTFFVDDSTNTYTASLENVTPYYNSNYKFEFGGENKAQNYSICVINSVFDLSGTYLKQGNIKIWEYKAISSSAINWNEPISVNWDYANVINTRGNSQYSASNYTNGVINGHNLYHAILNISAGGLNLSQYTSGTNGYLIQRYKSDVTAKMLNKQLTVSALVDGKLVFFSFTPTSTTGLINGIEIFSGLTLNAIMQSGPQLEINFEASENSSATYCIQGIKLEFGDIQTLAIKSNGIWNLIKNQNLNIENLKGPLFTVTW